MWTTGVHRAAPARRLRGGPSEWGRCTASFSAWCGVPSPTMSLARPIAPRASEQTPRGKPVSSTEHPKRTRDEPGGHRTLQRKQVILLWCIGALALGEGPRIAFLTPASTSFEVESGPRPHTRSFGIREQAVVRAGQAGSHAPGAAQSQHGGQLSAFGNSLPCASAQSFPNRRLRFCGPCCAAAWPPRGYPADRPPRLTVVGCSLRLAFLSTRDSWPRDTSDETYALNRIEN